MRDNLVIFGPTASGKSSLALEVARNFDGEIINMDSMQVYRYMDVATAKPSLDERSLIPHHLFDLVEPQEDFTSHDYKRMALEAIGEIRSRGKNPILVGGTGLYLSSLYYDFEFRKRDEVKRSYYSDILKREGLARLQDLAKELYPKLISKVDINNPHRLLRLLESGSLDQEKKRSKLPLKLFIISWDPQGLNRRIEERIKIMHSQGLIDEVEQIYKDYGAQEYLSSIRGIGYKEYYPYIKGLISLEEATENHVIATRQYAKRQRTWARNQYPQAQVIEGRLALEEQLRIIEENWR